LISGQLSRATLLPRRGHKTFMWPSRSRHPGMQDGARLVRGAWRETMIARPPPAWSKPVHSAENRNRAQRPDCPHCGSRLLVAEQSRFDLAGRIDHVWVCDDCGAQFETSTEVTDQAVA